MTDALAVWLYGQKVAIVTNERRRLRLEYTPEARSAYPGGTPLLSLKLPVTDERYPSDVVRSFLEGLLPEGEPRRTIAEDLGIPSNDTYALIDALGRDCAGAVVIQRGGDPAPVQPSVHTAERLSDEELGELVANLRSAPLGIDRRVRISLAGHQEKLLLTQLSDGSWGRPVDGTPSTHILKPEIRDYPHTVENEAFCMRFAKHLGLTVPEVRTTEVRGRKLLVVSRYDRVVDHSGRVERIHQEDICQAMGLLPDKKYQEDGGPSLRQIASILTAYDPDSLSRFVRAIIVNVLVGNGDADGKNYSLLHSSNGAIALSPLYDVMSTLIYGDDRLAMYIDSVQRTNRATGNRLVNEIDSWEFSRDVGNEIVEDVLAQVGDAMERAKDETPGVPDHLLEVLGSQSALLRSATTD